MSKYGPTRKEHWFRLCFSLFGLAMIFYALVIQGQGLNVMTFDGLAFGGVFFSGSAGWSGWKLWRGEAPNQ